MNRSTCMGIAFVTGGLLALAGPAPAQTTHTVELDGIVFVPADLTIDVGDTVHWQWVSGFHNVESGIVQGIVGVPDGNFRSGAPTADVVTTFDLTFDAAFLAAEPMPGNAYPYYCVVHTSVNMVGSITVQAGGCTTDGDCDDGDDCTDDSCDPATGCLNTDNTAPCDDGDACTTVDTCSLGVCVGGAAPNCDDGNVCTDDSCNPATGCVNTDNTDSCDDGEACTTGDTCSLGVCVGGAAPVCDDGNVCTDDSCNPATGCVHSDNAAPCDDGFFCTLTDVCTDGICVGSGDPCPGQACDEISNSCFSCVVDADCGDSNVCTRDACVDGNCEYTDVDGACDDGDDNSMSSSDEDGDGVFDDLDQCADTPVGEPVDSNGCSEDQAEVIDDNAPAPLPEENASGVSTQSQTQFCGLFGMISFLCIFIGLAGFRAMLRRPERSHPLGGGP